MAQHGYLHDKYDNDDFGRGDDRERGDWYDDSRGRWDDRPFRGERGRGFMFDERNPGRSREHSAFSSPSPEHARDRFRDDDRHSGRDDWRRSGGRFSASTDDHYRSWRDRQMQALDRDYEDYCREREQQFHQDFDSWRRDRQNPGSGQQGQSSEEVMDLDNPMIEGGGEIPGAGTSPLGAATLGTNNSENTASAPNAAGRGRR